MKRLPSFFSCSYSEAGLVKAGLTTLYYRRSTLCKELFMDIDTQGNHKLIQHLPVRSQQHYTLRLTRAFAAPVCKTNRFRDHRQLYHQPLYVIYFKFSIYIFIVNILSARNSANWLQGVFINKRSYYCLYSRVKIFVFGVNGKRHFSVFVLFDLFQDYKKKNKNKRQSFPFSVCHKLHALIVLEL